MTCFAFLTPKMDRSGSSEHAKAQAWAKVMFLWALLWCLSLFIEPKWLASLGLSLNAHGHTHLLANGQPFADARSWWGIPNTLDVVSNLPMLFLGVWGVCCIHRWSPQASRVCLPVMLTFLGLVLTWAGSSLYHWHPVSETLVLDRMGMAVTFAGVLGWVLTERLQVDWANRFVLCLLVAGGVSAALPLWGDRVMPWAVVQFGGLAMVLAHAILPNRESADHRKLASPWLALVIGYAFAKWLEIQDEQVYMWTQYVVAGHTLKHLVAAYALIPLTVKFSCCGKINF